MTYPNENGYCNCKDQAGTPCSQHGLVHEWIEAEVESALLGMRHSLGGSLLQMLESNLIRFAAAKDKLLAEKQAEIERLKNSRLDLSDWNQARRLNKTFMDENALLKAELAKREKVIEIYKSEMNAAQLAHAEKRIEALSPEAGEENG